MSELKEHQFCESDEFFREYPGPLSNELRLYYLKSEADKVIAHQKRKRCLAMAMWCETRHFAIRYLQADKISNDENYIGTFYYIRREYMIKHYCRWANKWLELAEKFKDSEH